MGRRPDFIGLGAQRAGTTWLYACLFDHPSLCVPIKEIHFFSSEQAWARGFDWYESLFRLCPATATVGEFSTSYLASAHAAERIRARYPRARLVVSLRNPVDRAYSNYLHDIARGSFDPAIPFRQALAERPHLVEGSRYATHLGRYLRLFAADQVLVLVYEDAARDPRAFVARVYRFLGVDAGHVPASLDARINAGRVPRFPGIDRVLTGVSRGLRARGLHRLLWMTKGVGLGNGIRLGNWLRAINARSAAAGPAPGPDPGARALLGRLLADDVRWVERLLGRELPEWTAAAPWPWERRGP